MAYRKLFKSAIVLLILVLLVVILRFGKPFLMPLTFAALLAMLLLPISKWLEKKKIHKAFSAILSILVMVAFFASLIAFVSWQASDIAQNTSKMKQQVSDKYQQVQEFVSKKLGIPPEKQKEIMKKQQSSSGGNLGSMAGGLIMGLGGLLTNILLVLVYIFLFLYFRGHIKRFMVRLAPDHEEDKALDIVNRSQKVSQKYLTGLSLMIVGLWIMYSIGFSIAGVKNAIFFAILCGVLEIVPFVGNLVGTGITILMALTQGGGVNMVVGILITYGLVQFIQSYILEPLVVGSEVNINPLFTIVGLVAGETLWGIPGMILAIPVMGIAKIACDHIETLKPYGEFMGEEKKGHQGFKKKMNGFVERVKARFINR